MTKKGQTYVVQLRKAFKTLRLIQEDYQKNWLKGSDCQKGKVMIEDDTWYKCTVCGREGRVGRCCGDETRIPLNRLAEEEQKHILELREVGTGFMTIKGKVYKMTEVKRADV